MTITKSKIAASLNQDGSEEVCPECGSILEGEMCPECNIDGKLDKEESPLETVADENEDWVQ